MKPEYNNLCIMDGMIMHFRFEWGRSAKGTTLSNYYLANLQSVIDFVNETMPPKYQLKYDKIKLEKEMKECPQKMIMN